MHVDLQALESDPKLTTAIFQTKHREYIRGLALVHTD